MRCRFNKARFTRRIQAGEVVERVKANHMSEENARNRDLPHCSQTLTIRYIDVRTNVELVRAHQYEFPNKTRRNDPDPKELLHNGLVWHRLEEAEQKLRDQADWLNDMPLWFRRIWGKVRCYVFIH